MDVTKAYLNLEARHVDVDSIHRIRASVLHRAPSSAARSPRVGGSRRRATAIGGARRHRTAPPTTATHLSCHCDTPSDARIAPRCQNPQHEKASELSAPPQPLAGPRPAVSAPPGWAQARPYDGGCPPSPSPPGEGTHKHLTLGATSKKQTPECALQPASPRQTAIT